MKAANRILTTLALLGAMGTAQAYPVFVQMLTSPQDIGTWNAGWSTEVYTNISFKINSRYTLTPELDFKVDYSANSYTHKFLRFVVSDKNLAKLGDWTLQVTYRWAAPTTLGAQAAGSYGTFMWRPAITAKFGSVNMLIREAISLPLNRNVYQVNPVGSAAPKGNVLLQNGLEILPSMEFAETFDVGFVFLSYQYLNGAAKGATGTNMTFVQDIELEVGNTIKSAGDLRVALNYTTSKDPATFGESWKLFKKDNSYITLVLEKAL